MDDGAHHRRHRHVHAQPLDVARAHQVVLFERILRRRVNSEPALKRADRTDRRFAVARVADVARRKAGKVHGHEVGCRQRADEIGQRADDFQRLHPADVVLVQKNRKEPDVVASRLAFLVRDGTHRTELFGSGPIPTSDVPEACHRHGDAVVENLEVGGGQIFDVAPIACDDRHVDEHDVGAAAKSRRRKLRRRRLNEQKRREDGSKAH